MQREDDYDYEMSADAKYDEYALEMRLERERAELWANTPPVEVDEDMLAAAERGLARFDRALETAYALERAYRALETKEAA
jgi:hypothetical protein